MKNSVKNNARKVVDWDMKLPVLYKTYNTPSPSFSPFIPLCTKRLPGDIIWVHSYFGQ